MGCLALVRNCLYSTLEQLGIYEPEIDVEEARNRLKAEKEHWSKFQDTENSRGSIMMQMGSMTIDPLLPIVQKAVDHLKSHHIKKGIAVDLGCGICPRSFQLLEQGWKVYAVDYSNPVIKTLERKVAVMGKDWIESGRLVLIHQSIETFEYPEKIHLIIAIESLPYCDPEKIHEVFLKGKNALLPRGMFVGNLFPYNDLPLADGMLRGIGAWMTTKNVVQAILRSVDFPSWIVLEEKSPGGIAKQFHVFGEFEIHDPLEFREICGEDDTSETLTPAALFELMEMHEESDKESEDDPLSELMG